MDSEDQRIHDSLEFIRFIDAMFAENNNWGSWMAGASKQRAQAVEFLKQHGIEVEHKYELVSLIRRV